MQQIKELINQLHLEDLHNVEHPSIFEECEGYCTFIVRIPELTNDLTMVSLGFIITSQQCYYFNKENNEFEIIENIYIGLYNLINKRTDKLLKSFVKYQEVILDMEESLYANNITGDFLSHWLSVKLELLRIERVLVRTTSTMREFIEYYKDNEGFQVNHYTDIHEHLERTMRSATLQLSKLDYLYSFYNAKSNDKMNKMIYILTIISAIFLPLNLLVGFFGMNTTALPFTTGNTGTYYALSLMISLVVITSIIVQIWRKKLEN